MVLAVLQVRDLDLDPLRRLLGLLLDGIELGAQLLVLRDLGFEELRRLAVLVEKIDHAGLDFRNDPAADFGVAELVFGLRLEHRALELYGDGARDAFAHVNAVLVLLVKLVDALEEPFAERGQVRAAVARCTGH